MGQGPMRAPDTIPPGYVDIGVDAYYIRSTMRASMCHIVER